eukprot:gene7633-583_t
METRMRSAFTAVQEHVASQLTATCNEYELLEKLNAAANTEVESMVTAMDKTNENMKKILTQEQNLQPVFDQIDQVVHVVDESQLKRWTNIRNL